MSSSKGGFPEYELDVTDTARYFSILLNNGGGIGGESAILSTKPLKSRWGYHSSMPLKY